jgi:hypothetical protein
VVSDKELGVLDRLSERIDRVAIGKLIKHVTRPINEDDWQRLAQWLSGWLRDVVLRGMT